MLEGRLMSGSPDCNIDRIFISKFYFPHKVTKANQNIRIYQNPIFLAREYKQMIDNGQVINQSDLAHKLGVFRVRIHQILSLLQLGSLILQELEKLGDPLEAKIITERMLRSYVNKSFREQKELLYLLKALFKV
jgi:hypothetical protein